ncbi:hypothetical protein Halha_2408 [Halobacteroides halobius DSM 5150]|uniref:Porin domain-containing protein n=1 Tax=Halobacteroides halobius (strain ATCC 35273 / DSM 5150 / MD-1) TaxID=748449 RepID=L0KAH0_HALHC|nr:hypothetical protein [Halobacteroides halobius]AGB42282.1 hypothetical protein Halha_2408 [Halobacteroides halobius DSM 5150]
MKKITTLLAFVLVLALAIPAFAAKDNVKITGETITTYDKFSGEYNALEEDWEDGEILDDDKYFEDNEEKVFNQELNLNLLAETEGATIDVALNLDNNDFAGEEVRNLKLDTGKVTVENDTVTVKAGDLGGYTIADYYLHDEDLEGIEASTAVAGLDLKVLYANQADTSTTYKVVEAATDVAGLNLTGRVLTNGVKEDKTYAVEAKTTLSDITLNGTFVTNEGNVIRAGASMPFAGGTLNADVEKVDADFIGVKDDDVTVTEDKTEYTVGVEALPLAEKLTVDSKVTYNEDATVEAGATYAVVADVLSVNGKYTYKAAKDADNIIEAGAKYTPTKAATAEVSYKNEGETTTIKANGSYDLTDALVLKAEAINKDNKADVVYTYLEGGAEYTVAKDVTLNTTVAKLADDADNASTRVKTTLDVKF